MNRWPAGPEKDKTRKQTVPLLTHHPLVTLGVTESPILWNSNRVELGYDYSISGYGVC